MLNDLGFLGYFNLMKKLLLSIVFATANILLIQFVCASQNDFSVPTGGKKWFASWCTSPDASQRSYEVLLFRRSFELSEKPSTFNINVSADNRFRLFVNGKSVATGPARGDLEHWRFDTLDIAPQLKKGKNTIAAIVWNFANSAPAAQITNETAFLLDGASKAEEFVATPKNWKVKKSAAFSTPAAGGFKGAGNFSFTGACDMLDASKLDWDWNLTDFDDSSWKSAKTVSEAMTHSGPWGENTGWSLVAREIPQPEEKIQRLSKIRKFEGSDSVKNFIQGEKFTIPANSRAFVIADNSTLTNAYPHLVTSRGKGSCVKVIYAEALFEKTAKKATETRLKAARFQATARSTFSSPTAARTATSRLYGLELTAMSVSK